MPPSMDKTIYILLGIIRNSYIIWENVYYAIILYKGSEYCEFWYLKGVWNQSPQTPSDNFIKVICSPQCVFKIVFKGL